MISSKAHINIIIATKNYSHLSLMKDVLKSVPDMTIQIIVDTGYELIQKLNNLKPDIILLGIELEDMNGSEATKSIMSSTPTPILMFCCDKGCKKRTIAFEAVCNGAIDVVELLNSTDEKISFATKQRFLEAIRISSKIRTIKRFAEKKTSKICDKKFINIESSNTQTDDNFDKLFIIGIAASTGGPGVLLNIINHLPKKTDFAVLIVQHIVASFTTDLVSWLKEETKRDIVLAKDMENIRKNCFYIAPGNKHMLVNKEKKISLNSKDLYTGHRPSANILFQSLAKNVPNQSMGVVLTGMGKDGLEGLREMHSKQMPIIAQDEKSSVVFGMPKVCIDEGLALSVVGDDCMAKEMSYYYSKFQRRCS